MARSMHCFSGLIAALLALGCASVQSQATDPCITEKIAVPARSVYRCPNGLLIEAEAAAILGIAASPDQDRIDAVTLQGGAVLIDLAPGNGSFEILTPYAIASVRGTEFVVDAQDAATSVFVLDGVVAVSRGVNAEIFELSPGEGITVSKDRDMQVTTWPEDKVSTLLARFAR